MGNLPRRINSRAAATAYPNRLPSPKTRWPERAARGFDGVTKLCEREPRMVQKRLAGCRVRDSS